MHLPGVKIPLMVALLLCGVTASWGNDYLYSPKLVEGESAGEGVLVREVTVKKGDNLSRIAKKYSGRDYYYPQILLFNEIKNPHWIQIGQVLRVPLSRKGAQKHKPSLLVENASERKPVAQELMADTTKKRPEKQRPVTAAVRAENSAYNHALNSFKQGDCEEAIKQFDGFISRYPASALLPEATLNRAECYLKLSVK